MKTSKKFIYFFLFGLVFLRYSISFLIITSFPKLSATFSLSNLQLGTIISIYYLTSIIFIFYWLYLFKKYRSPYKVFLVSSFLWVLGSIFFGFSQNYLLLLIFAAIIGAGIESTTIYSLLILFKISTKSSQGKIFSLFISIQGIGSLFGAFITSYFEDVLNFSWGFVFVFIGLISCIYLIISGLLLTKYRGLEDFENFKKIGYDLKLRDFRKVLNKKTNQFLVIIWIYSTPIIFILNTWTQKYFLNFHGLSQMEASLSYIFLSGGEFLGMMVGGLFFDSLYSDKHYKKIYIAIAGTLISIPLLLMGFFIPWTKESLTQKQDVLNIAFNLFSFALQNSVVFFSYITLFFGFFSFAVIYPLFLILINDCNEEEDKSTMISLRNFLMITGQIVSPFIGGILIDTFSILFTLVIVPIFLIIPLTHLILMRNTIKNDFLTDNRHNK